ncbi:hypothetical protein [Streptomyces sp. NPDC002133]|uniref:ATP-dependent DNA ligase n=1 Tax=Streptomyces sp. NPDC002133 TaxID=3154409 RepID=UPI0033341836
MSSSSGATDGSPLEALQHRAFAGGRTVEQRATTLPAHFIDFDVLQTAGQEVITEPYDHRGAVLEDLFTEQEPTPPGTLCPMTTDIAVAQEWLETWTDVQGGGDLVDRVQGCPHEGLLRSSALGWGMGRTCPVGERG